MNAELQALAERTIACKGWRWLPGMRTASGYRVEVGPCFLDAEDVCDFHGGHHAYRGARYSTAEDLAVERMTPDFSDPATLGCLLALVREAWDSPSAYACRHDTYSPNDGHRKVWICHAHDGDNWAQFSAASEAEALVAALEAAP